MIRKLMRHRAIRILGLIAVTPLLIGHGAGFCPFGCDSAPEYRKDFVISGSADPSSFLNVGYNLNVDPSSSLGYSGYTSPASAAGGSVPPLQYFFIGSSNSTYHRITVTVNDGAPVGSIIGEMWVHTGDKRIKLMHPAAASSYLSAHFTVDDQGFNLPQSSTIAATSDYTLSGGSTGSEVLEMGSPITIYVNGVIKYTRDAADNPVTPPIVFTANPGDVLRIVARGAYSSSLPSIWLHMPSGNGIKLSHAAESRRPVATDIFFDTRYVLE